MQVHWGKSQQALHKEKLNLTDLLWFFGGWCRICLHTKGIQEMPSISILREIFDKFHIFKGCSKQSEMSNKENNLHYRNRELSAIEEINKHL